MSYISIKTAYNTSTKAGKSYPADGAMFLIDSVKHMLIGYKLEKILNTWAADYNFSADQIINKSIANDIEWEGPFVFVIHGQNLFINFSAPEHYEIGINSQCVSNIVDISSKYISELKKNGNNREFTDISFLYGDNIIGQIVKDIYVITDERYEFAHLSAVIIELKNNFCLTISEEIDNPMLRVYSDKKEAMQAIIEQQKKKLYE